MDVKLGPIDLPWPLDDLKEALGDTIETVGAGVVAGERRARPFNLVLPIRDDSGGLKEVGYRLRRQVRSLMENPARFGGLYFRYDTDPEFNAWLIVGGGEVSEENAGAAFGEWRLELSDVYKVGSLRTHRPARRLIVMDRRLETTARDYLGRLYSTDFSAITAVAEHVLPVGATDLTTSAGKPPLTVTNRLTRDGNLVVVTSEPDGEVISYEQLEADQDKASVLIRDRRGDLVNETVWEDVYGPDYPLTAGDVPVLDNGLARVRWVAAQQAFAIDSWTGVWSEQARFTLWTQSMTPVLARATVLNSVGVAEWSPERAVLRVIMSDLSTPTRRTEVYLTLQRGWSGPRVETYAAWADASRPIPILRLAPATPGEITVTTAIGGVETAVTSPNGTWAGQSLGSFAGKDPWVAILPQSPTLGLHAAVLQESVRLFGRDDADQYGGAARRTLEFQQRVADPSVTFPLPGYLSIQLGVGPRASVTTNAFELGVRGLYDARQVPELSAR